MRARIVPLFLCFYFGHPMASTLQLFTFLIFFCFVSLCFSIHIVVLWFFFWHHFFHCFLFALHLSYFLFDFVQVRVRTISFFKYFFGASSVFGVFFTFYISSIFVSWHFSMHVVFPIKYC